MLTDQLQVVLVWSFLRSSDLAVVSLRCAGQNNSDSTNANQETVWLCPSCESLSALTSAVANGTT